MTVTANFSLLFVVVFVEVFVDVKGQEGLLRSFPMDKEKRLKKKWSNSLFVIFVSSRRARAPLLITAISQCALLTIREFKPHAERYP